MIEKLIIEREEMEEAVALYMVVNGQEHLVCSTSYEEAGSRAMEIVEEAACNLTRYTSLKLEERYPELEEEY
jgi:hypothetical protein